jgi:hypothetical protein
VNLEELIMIRSLFVALAVSLAVSSFGSDRPAPSGSPELRIETINISGSIDVVLSPSPDGLTRVWKEGNSWGARNWRVFVIRGATLLAFRKDPDQVFPMNVASFDELRNAARISLNLNSDVWIGPKVELGGFRSGDEVIVAYDVPVTAEAKKYGVWYGTLSTLASVK